MYKKIIAYLLVFVLIFSSVICFNQQVLATDWVEKQSNKTIPDGAYATQTLYYNYRMSAQTFRATSDYYLSNIDLYLKRTGNPTSTYRVGIKAVTDGVPSGEYLVYTDVSFSTISTSWSWVGVYFYGGYAEIEMNDYYAIIVEPYSSGSDDNNYISWRATFEDVQPVIGHLVYDLSISSQWEDDVHEIDLQDQLYIVYGASADFGISVTTGEAYLRQSISDNFSVNFYVYSSTATDNATAILVSEDDVDLSQAIDSDDWYSNPISLYKRYVDTDNTTFEFMTNTTNLLHPATGELLPNKYYYYQGRAEIDGITYYSDVGYFMTTATGFPNIPSVDITSIKDVSESYGTPYTFEVVAKIDSNNTTTYNINQGFHLSLSSYSGVTLDPPVYSYNVNDVDVDNTFRITYTLNALSGYSGQTFYIRAFMYNSFYGDIYSDVKSYSPQGGISGGVSSTGISDFSTLVDNARVSLGMTGIMGMWAFMFVILLIVALLFGTIAFTVGKDIKKPLVIIWCLISISVVGAFVFTGKLGIWPILIMVGFVVLLVMALVSMKLSGGEA